MRALEGRTGGKSTNGFGQLMRQARTRPDRSQGEVLFDGAARRYRAHDKDRLRAAWGGWRWKKKRAATTTTQPCGNRRWTSKSQRRASARQFSGGPQPLGKRATFLGHNRSRQANPAVTLHTPSGRSDLILRSCLAVGRLCGRLEERRDAVSSRENACNGALAARPPATTVSLPLDAFARPQPPITNRAA